MKIQSLLMTTFLGFFYCGMSSACVCSSSDCAVSSTPHHELKKNVKQDHKAKQHKPNCKCHKK